MKIYTSCFETMKHVNSDKLIYVSIARGGVPVDFPHPIVEELFDMAPSWDLIKAWKSGSLTWDEYTEKFKKETSFDKNVFWFKKYLQQLQNKNDNKDIVILCYCTKGDCHRHIVGEPIGAVELTSEMIDKLRTVKLVNISEIASSIPDFL